MEVERIQCTVKTNQNGNTNLSEVVKAGPDALVVTEIPLLRRQHEDPHADPEDGAFLCCINNAKVVGAVKITDRKQHKDWLIRKYGAQLVEAEYPGSIPRNFPKSLDDCDIPRSNVIATPKEGTKDWYVEKLTAAGTDFPSGASVKDLKALYESLEEA